MTEITQENTKNYARLVNYQKPSNFHSDNLTQVLKCKFDILKNEFRHAALIIIIFSLKSSSFNSHKIYVTNIIFINMYRNPKKKKKKNSNEFVGGFLISEKKMESTLCYLVVFETIVWKN